jgi:hypothetical protein
MRLEELIRRSDAVKLLSYCRKIISAEYVTKQNRRLNLVKNLHTFSAECRAGCNRKFVKHSANPQWIRGISIGDTTLEMSQSHPSSLVVCATERCEIGTELLNVLNH